MDIFKAQQACWAAMSAFVELARKDAQLEKIKRDLLATATEEEVAAAEAVYNGIQESMNVTFQGLKESVAELNKELNG